MEYRTLGNTDLRVSALGFGCGAIGGLMVRGDQPTRLRAVERAVEAGITYFDTAQMYGDGCSPRQTLRISHRGRLGRRSARSRYPLRPQSAGYHLRPDRPIGPRPARTSNRRCAKRPAAAKCTRSLTRSLDRSVCIINLTSAWRPRRRWSIYKTCVRRCTRNPTDSTTLYY